MLELEDSAEQKKVRSPSFPFIGLREAVERARRLYEAERRNAARPEVAVTHWGYSPKSSGGKQTIAALRAFGLLEGDGSVRLTELAVRILLEDAGSEGWRELVRQAALSPPVYATLWERYGADLPSDRNLRAWLVLELGFNENAVGDLLRGYKETLAWAGLREEAAEAERGSAAPVPSPAAARETRPEPASELSLSFPLGGGNRGEFRVQSRISPREAEQLRTLFEFWLEKIVDPRSG